MNKTQIVFVAILFLFISLLTIICGFGSTTTYQDEDTVPNFSYSSSTDMNIRQHEKRIYAVEEEISALKARMELYSDIINDMIKENNELKSRLLKLEKKKR